MNLDRSIKIKKALLELGVTQVQVSRELEVERASVNRYISGKRKSEKFEIWARKNLSPHLSAADQVQVFGEVVTMNRPMI